MKCLNQNLRAISPVLAVLLITAIVIVAALAAYAWFMGYIDLSTERSGQAIILQRVANDDTDTDLLVYVQNVGEVTMQLEETGCLYVNGERVVCAITAANVSSGVATLNQGETAMLRYVGGASPIDEKVTVRVTSVHGTFCEKSYYPSETVYSPPVLSYFAFEAIESPQIPNKAFNITVRALDQYYAIFSDYNGSNTLKLGCPDGEINPTTTGNFSRGIWTGEVNVTCPTTKVSIFTSAQSDSSKGGRSNAFNIANEEDITLWIVTVTAVAVTAVVAVLIYHTKKRKTGKVLF